MMWAITRKQFLNYVINSVSMYQNLIDGQCFSEKFCVPKVDDDDRHYNHSNHRSNFMLDQNILNMFLPLLVWNFSSFCLRLSGFIPFTEDQKDIVSVNFKFFIPPLDVQISFSMAKA